LCQKRTLCSAANCGLVDQLIGSREEGLRDCQPQRLCGFELDDELEFGCLLHWDITGLGPT